MDVNKKIFELFDLIDESSLEDDNVLSEELTNVDAEWDNLPAAKMEDSDRTLLAMAMMDSSIKVKKFDLAKKWTDIYLYKESHQEMIELYLGQLDFYQEKYKNAYERFKTASDLSNGRVFNERPEFLDLLKNPDKYIKS
jgi:hypothetical protein